MARNPARRTELLDAATDLLAAVGARGLTFRGVDEQAGAPTGTTSNYFRSREDLLQQLCDHVFTRLAPDPAYVAERLAAPRTRALETTLMHDLVARADADRAGHLALFELRLEAARQPALGEVVTARFRANLEAITADHVEGGFPGGPEAARALYLAMTGFLFEHLTLPGLHPDSTELVTGLVERIVPADS
ncbi:MULTISPECIES: TetR/AcrR family transcriptional regulator [Pimelobacter]|uniref:TetR/AcrR family transcriptional regulator n=1 Tax=Pimelobacter TaxID=2044 RepID=UPI001C03FA21|nr:MULTISPECIES: TetR family transcriptional regulator [Pimelobacter]MBU2694678.1 TetR family transcriptional regulator [Pimelobacter sp. 30-1]UUW92030.1 TetR family transcriptional regulator [Pimelobacter simplex]UUW95857.1 TetR family transcriptional regulator [Pimelobacter simplex]